MLFKKLHVEKILRGEKTQTRRSARRRGAGNYKVGRRYGVQASWMGRPTAFILITGKRLQRLDDITPEDARREGGYDLESYRAQWEKINGGRWDPDEVVWVYDFKLLLEPAGSPVGGMEIKNEGDVNAQRKETSSQGQP